MKFSLVSTIFNEASRLQESINDIERQTLLPNEVVIVDAGSKDGTLDILNQWKLGSNIDIKIIVNKGCNVAEGRNIAISQASYELIVSTDFGCRYHPEWLQSLITPFNDENVEVVAGNFAVKSSMLSTPAAKSAYLLASGYKNIMDEHFIPSSRSIAYYKKVWSSVGGYPEWVTLAGDDTYFGYQLKNAGYSFYLSSKPMVYWERHADAIAYDKEAYRYGLGDGETKDSVNQRNALVKFIELLLRVGCLVFLILSFLLESFLYPFIIAVICAIGFRPYVKLFKFWIKEFPKFTLHHLVRAILMLESNRWHYLKGYLKGLRNK
ncbi:MAG: glycosyltransferase [Fulvivirga sp.]